MHTTILCRTRTFTLVRVSRRVSSRTRSYRLSVSPPIPLQGVGSFLRRPLTYGGRSTYVFPMSTKGTCSSLPPWLTCGCLGRGSGWLVSSCLWSEDGLQNEGTVLLSVGLSRVFVSFSPRLWIWLPPKKQKTPQRKNSKKKNLDIHWVKYTSQSSSKDVKPFDLVCGSVKVKLKYLYFLQFMEWVTNTLNMVWRSKELGEGGRWYSVPSPR